MLVLMFVGSLVLSVVLGLMATERPVGQSADHWYAREIVAPLSGMAALDVPLVMILGSSLCLLPAWLVWRWARARGVLWPCSGAVATGIAAAMAAGQLAEGLPAFAHLFRPISACSRSTIFGWHQSRRAASF